MESRDQVKPPAWRRIVALTALVVAGETIFVLPFVLARVFRPTILDVFQLTNLELGGAFALYGVVAMVAYFLGGPLADRFSPRKLLSIALVTTSLGGLLMATIPGLGALKFLYGYWGFTTIALFWSALIRATRQWGGAHAQGAAFGLLDGGRGLLTALTGSMMVALYASFMPEEVESATLDVRADALRQVIGLFASMTFAAAVLVWFALPRHHKPNTEQDHRSSLAGVRRVLSIPAVWVQSFIILCAYVGFKATDDFSLYAKDVLELNEVEAARAGTVSLWIRPIGAIGAGFLADRLSAGLMTVGSFALLLVGSLVLASGALTVGMLWPFLLTIVTASLGIFALRGLYYAVMQEGKVPLAFTGSAVGVVSVIGYTPDVFMGPLMGVLLDRAPGAAGHQHVFWVIAGFALAGLVASGVFLRMTGGRRTAAP